MQVRSGPQVPSAPLPPLPTMSDSGVCSGQPAGLVSVEVSGGQTAGKVSASQTKNGLGFESVSVALASLAKLLARLFFCRSGTVVAS